MKFIIAIALFLGVIVSQEASGQDSKSATTKSQPTYVIKVTQGNTSLGEIVIKLWPDVAPLHCAFFDARVKEGWYDGTAFHRVIPNFMIQGGDPNSKDQPRASWGTGGYPEKVKAEFSNTVHHVRGVLSAARTNDPNSFSGQFFICTGSPTQLDGKYTAFGEVVSGMEVADKIVNSPRDNRDNPLEKIEMTISKREG